jgi:hypothetical protein
VVRAVYLWAIENDIQLWAPDYVKSAENLSDDLSRMEDFDDWIVSPWVFTELDREWGPHTVDRMADSQNTKLPRFNAAWLCPGMESLDAFTQDWGADNNWVVPPFRLVHDVLLHVQECRARATLVIPRWPGQPWWPLLQELAVDEGLELDSSAFQRGPSGRVEPWGNRAWKFLAIRVSGTEASGSTY